MNIKKYIVSVMIGAAVLLPASVSFASSGLQYDTSNKQISASNKDYGNPFATSTLLYMTAGNSTTTIPFYSEFVDTAAVNLVYQASSTSSILNWRFEFSDDYRNWYTDDEMVYTSATSSTVTGASNYSDFKWIYNAQNTGGSSQTLTGYKHFKISNLIAKYTRIVFYVPVGAAAGGINVRITEKTNNPI